MTILFSNNASAAIASSISTSATTIVLSAGAGAIFPNPGVGEYFYATLTDNSNNLEIIKVTARSGDTLTVQRGKDGTTARTYSAGSVLELRLTAAALADFQAQIAAWMIKQDASNLAYVAGGYFSTRTTNGVAIQDSIGSVNLFLVDSSGNATAKANVTAYSDARLKSDVYTIQNALDLVGQMRGVGFIKDGVPGVGVIAQEMQKVLPQVVLDGEYLSVAYGNLVGVLIEAVKELRAELKALKGE